MSSPELAVVVASHERPVDLRNLLDALAAQTLARERWEAVVVHDSVGPETEEVLCTHPLAAHGALRHLRLPPGASLAQNRNAAWRAARAATIVFTDDDCVPPPGWLGGMADAVDRMPGAVVQGATRPDPARSALLLADPHAHSQRIDPPSAWAQTCNIAYPREVLERVGGFDESLPLPAGEDTDLAQRALDVGVELRPAPGVITHHAVVSRTLRAQLAAQWRWQQLAAVVARHPRLRRELTLGVFWKRRHAALLVAAGGALGSGRRPALALLLLPWALLALPNYGPGWRGRVRAVSELPGRAAVDVVEIAALARGSVRHRTLLL